jgi:hypothetical protein
MYLTNSGTEPLLQQIPLSLGSRAISDRLAGIGCLARVRLNVVCMPLCLNPLQVTSALSPTVCKTPKIVSLFIPHSPHPVTFLDTIDVEVNVLMKAASVILP